jgi:hypothetical protein
LHPFCGLFLPDEFLEQPQAGSREDTLLEVVGKVVQAVRR